MLSCKGFCHLLLTSNTPRPSKKKKTHTLKHHTPVVFLHLLATYCMQTSGCKFELLKGTLWKCKLVIVLGFARVAVYFTSWPTLWCVFLPEWINSRLSQVWFVCLFFSWGLFSHHTLPLPPQKNKIMSGSRSLLEVDYKSNFLVSGSSWF